MAKQSMTVFKHPNRVHMYDTDMAGILYFANQFRFFEDTWEAFMLHHGYSLTDLFSDTFPVRVVVVHVESDYHVPVFGGDDLSVHLSVSNIGETSFTNAFEVFRKGDDYKVGSGKMSHVCLDPTTTRPIAIPSEFKTLLMPYCT